LLRAKIGTLASDSVKAAEQAGELINQIVPGINRTSDLIQEMTSASQEQSNNIAQINHAMGQMNQITQQNASASEELAATAEEMTSQAEQLMDIIDFSNLKQALKIFCLSFNLRFLYFLCKYCVARVN